ncbi:MAG: right-handed parallel beta-helix repeat-containing protein [Methanothrix sp.]
MKACKHSTQFIYLRKAFIVKCHESWRGINFTKPLIGVFILVVYFVSAYAYDNGSLENGTEQNAIASNSINGSNSSLLNGTLNLEISQPALAGNISLVAENSAIHFINQSINFDYNDSYNFRLANVSLNAKDSLNLSIWSGIAKNNISEKEIYNSKELAIKLPDMSSKLTGLQYALQAKSSSSNNSEGNLIGDRSLDSAFRELNESEPLGEANQSNESIILVHSGESIQDAINAAAPGDIIEIYSGTYNESLLIDKRLTIRGMDIGGELPIIDAGRMGNVIEISADQVILEKIVSTNSSNSSRSQGAGIQLSLSNNCSIDGVTSYNNYYGIDLVDSNYNKISNSNISNNEVGVRIYFSNDNRLEQNDVNKNNNPLKVTESIGNLIQGNNFRDNLNKLEESSENEFRKNKEIPAEDDDESKQGVIRNTDGRTQPSKHSDSGGNGEWIGRPVAADEARNCNIAAEKAVATVVFNPPSVMTIGVGEWIDARIGLENTTSLVQGLLGKGDVQYRNISAEMNMTYVVKLESDGGFEISEKRPAAQILGKDPAVWLWLVKPLEAGNRSLILSVDLQVEKPPYNSRCINVTYWPVAVNVLEPSLEQKATDVLSSSYKLIAGSIAFLASIFSLILLFRQLRKGKDEKK